MGLQPTKSPKRVKSKGNASNRKMLFIVLAVFIVMVVFIVFSVVRDMSEMQDDTEIISRGTQNVVSTPDTALQPPQTEPVVIDNDAPGLTGVHVEDVSAFHRTETGLIFDIDMQFSEAATIAEHNSISIGDELGISPMRTCVYHFDGNRVDISHTSGASLSVMRGSYKGDLDVASMDADLQRNITSGKAKDIKLANVYIGNAISGRYGTGQIDIDGTAHRIILAYIKRNNEVYSIIGLAEPDDMDFLDVLLSNVYIGSRSLIFE